MSSPRSNLASIAPLCREADPSLGRQACAAVWHEHGLLVVNPKHLNWADETAVNQLGTRLYGKRKGSQ